MLYPILIEPNTYDVVVPDLPGCYSSGDSMEDAIANATESIVGWASVHLEGGRVLPAPSTLAAFANHPDFLGWALALAHFDMEMVDGTVERVNVTLSRSVLSCLDRRAKRSNLSRSAMIAKLALEAEIPQRTA